MFLGTTCAHQPIPELSQLETPNAYSNFESHVVPETNNTSLLNQNDQTSFHSPLASELPHQHRNDEETSEPFLRVSGESSVGEHAILEQCSLPAVRGVCNEAQIRWFYNIRIRKCDTFLFSGCGGNGNNFLSLEDCEMICEIMIGK